MDIQGKVIVVTGASEGIGRALAQELARRGAKLVLAARSEDKIKELAKELPDAIAVQTDMVKPGDIENLVEQATAKYGRIDVLVNNAGQGMYTPVEKIDIEQYKKIMDLNVFAVVRAMQVVIPQMRAQGGGTIMNISSRVSQNYYPGLAAYASTKYALNAISLTAREELSKDNINVAIFMPRMTATNFGKNSVARTETWTPRPGPNGAMPQVDTAEQVAARVADQIEAGSAQEGM